MQVGINSNNANNLLFNTSCSLSNIGVLSKLGYMNQKDIEIIDEFLTKVSFKQTEYGAVQNRLESALDEISTQYENLVSSRSTIRDADLAEESASYIQQQILQQASATLLSTANQSPSIALQLI